MILARRRSKACGGCGRDLTHPIQRVGAGAVVNVDLTSKTVSVNSIADTQRLRQAIEKAGCAVTR